MTDAQILWAVLQFVLPGLGWALVVHAWECWRPGHPYVFVEVVGGVGATVLLDLLVVPPACVLYVFGGLALSALPQIAGAMYRAEQKHSAPAADQPPNRPDARDDRLLKQALTIGALESELADLKQALGQQ